LGLAAAPVRTSEASSSIFDDLSGFMMAPATDARSSFLDPVLLEIEGVETLSERIIAPRVTSKTSSILLCSGLIRLSCSDFLFTP
jgi:hypothetical protein